MIENFSANKLGCLDALQSPELKNKVLIFGKNGAGKSTIAAALRSLQTNDSEAITERASLNSRNAKPEFHLVVDGKEVTFENGAWSPPSGTNIAVFDQAFVNQNIHSGDQLDNDHKKKLYNVVLGNACVDKLQEQADLAEQIKIHNRRVKDVEREIESQIPGGIPFSDFLKLPPLETIDSEIEKQSLIVDLFTKSEKLRNAEGFEAIELRHIPASIGRTLAETIESLSGDAEAKVNQHLQDSTSKASTRWLEEGLKVQKDDDCPFCGASLANNSLIKAYQEFFSEAYNALKTEINSLPGLADGYLGQAELLKQQRQFDTNKNGAEFWQSYIEVPPLDRSIFERLREEISERRGRLIDSIELKKQNPLEAVALNDISFSSALVTEIDEYNSLVSIANKRIEDFRESQKKGDLSLETQKLNQLQAVKVRFSSEVALLVSEWESGDSTKAINTQRRKDLEAEIEHETSAVFEKQGTAINSVLEQLDANFRLAALETNNRTKPPSVQLCIEICDQKVQLGDKMTKTQRPFRSTLSGAERTMLAFAFFVSKLKDANRIADTIVVLDDPIANFDQIRLHNSAQVIAESLLDSKQLIVLSHNQQFLNEIYDKLPDAQLLYLTSDQGSGSQLTPCASWTESV